MTDRCMLPLMRAVVLCALVLALPGCGDSLEDRNDRAMQELNRAGQPTTSASVGTEGTPGSGSAAGRPSRPSSPSAPTELTELGYVEGDPSAPIRIIEFSDFGCGYCRRFHLEAYPGLKEKYVDSGKILWQYVPYVLGIFPNGLEAALAGECAGEQGLIEQYGTRLFEDQPEWKQEGADVNQLFLKYAREEGLDANRFETCLVEEWRRDRVRQNVIAGGQLGVRGTPTFFVPGYQPIQGALPPDVFEQILEYILAQQEQPAP